MLIYPREHTIELGDLRKKLMRLLCTLVSLGFRRKISESAL